MSDPSHKNFPDLTASPDFLFSQDSFDLAVMGFTDGLDSLEEEPGPEMETNLLYSMDSLDLFLCSSDELEKEAARRRAEKAKTQK